MFSTPDVAPLLGIPKPIALPVALDDVTAMRQSIERGPRQPFAAEHLGPVLERKIRRDDDAGSLVGGTDDVEEQFGAELAGRHVAEFIEDQQVELGQLSLDAN